jgi:bifunctional non-homologous end joining protein LigD
MGYTLQCDAIIDWLRNVRGATAIAPYSPRARKGAPVAVPVSWSELPRIDRADKYNMKNLRTRMKRLKGNPWEDYDRIRRSISREGLEFVEKNSIPGRE